MIFELYNEIRVIDPTPDFLNWIKKELTVSNPEYAKKERMGFWVGNTPRLIRLYETNGNDLTIPYGTVTLIPPEFRGQIHYTQKFVPEHEVDFQTKLEDFHLYDYQEEAVKQMVKAKEGILKSAAGSGKTQCGLALAVATKRKTLWLAHTLDLVNQSKQRALQFIPKECIGTIKEGQVDIGGCITFATVQTMAKLDLQKYRDEWDTIIVDEAHRVSASSKSVSMYQKVLSNLAARHKYGLSATVHRSDGLIKATFCLIGNVTYTVPDEAVADKIMKAGIQQINTAIPMSRECLNSDGTLSYTDLISYLTTNDERNKLIIQTLVKNRKHPSLILSDRLDHLDKLIALLPEDMKEQSCFISGKMTTKKGKKEREQAIEDMRTGKKKYLFATYSLAKEGLDIPNLEALHETVPQKDYAVVVQSVGRVQRTSKGKSEAIVYDYVDDLIPYCVNSFKKRKTIYKKLGSYYL